MRVKTTFTPIDTNGKPFNLGVGRYTLQDLANLHDGLVNAGVLSTDALQFAVDPQGTLTIVLEK